MFWLRVMAIWLLALCSVSVQAAISDPTFPVGFIESHAKKTNALDLTAILISPYRRIAVINATPVATGALIAGYKVIDIQPNYVVLDGIQGRITLFLLSHTVLKPSSIQQGNE